MSAKKSLTPFMAALVVAAFCSVTESAEWANLRGRFVYDGTPPAPKKLIPNKDVAFCGKFEIPDERLIVNQENGGIADIVIYLRKKPKRISPAYDEVLLDNINCRFDPHVQLFRTGQTLVVGNKDAIGHNSNFAMFRNALPNQLIPALGSFKSQIPDAEPFPVKVACNIHPWMSAVLVVKDHPYVAISDTNGKFTHREGEQKGARETHFEGRP